MVTANANMVVRESLLMGPSCPPLGCMCGVARSIRKRKANPPNNANVTGPISPISRAGMIKDQTAAATITPEAKPSNAF